MYYPYFLNYLFPDDNFKKDVSDRIKNCFNSSFSSTTKWIIVKNAKELYLWCK